MNQQKQIYIPQLHSLICKAFYFRLEVRNLDQVIIINHNLKRKMWHCVMVFKNPCSRHPQIMWKWNSKSFNDCITHWMTARIQILDYPRWCSRNIFWLWWLPQPLQQTMVVMHLRPQHNWKLWMTVYNSIAVEFYSLTIGHTLPSTIQVFSEKNNFVMEKYLMSKDWNLLGLDHLLQQPQRVRFWLQI
jgi:hypothetical protein